MRYLTLFLALLLTTACSAQPMSNRIKPHNAEQELQSREMQGGEVQLGQRRITVLSNVQITPVDGGAIDAQTIARVAGHNIRRHSSAGSVDARSPYVGAAYQHDTQEVGLISKEIAIHFTGSGIPLTYQKWGLKELITNSGIYILNVTDLKEWQRVVRQLASDSQVKNVNARIVTTERQAK
jgi:hypothetical protein